MFCVSKGSEKARFINQSLSPSNLLLPSPPTNSEVVEGDQSGGEFAVEEVVRLVDRPQAGIRIVIRIHAEAKRLVVPERRRAPVGRVVAEAVHLLRQALLLHPGFLVALSLLLSLALLLQLAAGLAGDLFLVYFGSGRGNVGTLDRVTEA